MNPLALAFRSLSVAWLLGALSAAPAFAEGSASSASSATSSAAGSASNSLQGSSNSSSQNPAPTAGDYRIETLAVAADRPGMVRLALQPVGEGQGTPREGFVLVLPQRTVDEQALVRGDTLSVRERAYGFEFARAQTGQAFFLVLADAWHHELDARPVNPTRL